MPIIRKETGDAIRGDRIAVKALNIKEGELKHGSGRHRIQTRILEGDVYCVIEIPLVYFRK